MKETETERERVERVAGRSGYTTLSTVSLSVSLSGLQHVLEAAKRFRLDVQVRGQVFLRYPLEEVWVAINEMKKALTRAHPYKACLPAVFDYHGKCYYQPAYPFHFWIHGVDLFQIFIAD